MKEYGQFDVPNNTQVTCEFPCPKCGTIVKETYKITAESHKDETAICPNPKCKLDIYVVVMHDAGTGTVNVPKLKDQKAVKAEGIAL